MRRIFIGLVGAFALILSSGFAVPSKVEAGSRGWGGVSSSKSKARRAHRRGHTRSFRRQQRKVRKRFRRKFRHFSNRNLHRRRGVRAHQRRGHHSARLGIHRNRVHQRRGRRVYSGHRTVVKHRKLVQDRLRDRGTRARRHHGEYHSRVGLKGRDNRLDRRAAHQLVPDDRPFKLTKSGAYARDARHNHQRRVRGAMNDGVYYNQFLQGYRSPQYYETYGRYSNGVGQLPPRNAVSYLRTSVEVERTDWQWVDLAVGPYDVKKQASMTCVRGAQVYKDLKEAGWGKFSQFLVSARRVQFLGHNKDKKPHRLVVDRCSGKILNQTSLL